METLIFSATWYIVGGGGEGVVPLCQDGTWDFSWDAVVGKDLI